jgi:DNA (cytosine-5)-methyltransferase 1
MHVEGRSVRKRSFPTVKDLFCGAGGSSKGAQDAGAQVLAAANHWQRACETYALNHGFEPDCADISQSDPRRYARTDILIASPECTNFSPAKGVSYADIDQEPLFGCDLCVRHGESNCPKHSDPVKRSRAGGWDIVKFTEHHRYEVVVIENVVQWLAWQDFDRWWRAMENLGYIGQKVFFNSMFAPPTPQSRDRLYIVWHRKGNRAPNLELNPLALCLKCQTHIEARQVFKPRADKKARYGKQYFYACPRCQGVVQPYYFAALNSIDLSIPAPPIGERKKHGLPPLKPRTLERIQYGIDRYGSQPLVITTNHVSADQPRPTQTTQTKFGVTLPPPGFMTPAGSNHFDPRGLDREMPTQTTSDRGAFVLSPAFIANLRGTAADQLPYTNVSVAGPLGTISAGGVHAAIINLRDWRFAQQLVSGVTDPIPTQVATAQTAIVSRSPFVVSYYSGGGQASGLEEPVPAITTLDRHGVVIPSIEEWCFRMFKPREIGLGMAFPPSYVVLGNDREQVRQYGNAVTPPVMRWLMHRIIESLNYEITPYDPWAEWRTGGVINNPDCRCDYIAPELVQAGQRCSSCTLAAMRSAVDEAPIPLIIHCPKCKVQHVDVDDGSGAWATSRLHKKHLCKPEDGGCGYVWKVSNRYTVGVRELPEVQP